MRTLSKAKEMAFDRVKGLWIAIPTPFDEAGELDEKTLAASVDYYIEALEVDGIFCGGVMGEFWALTLKERQRSHEVVMDATASRVPLMAHTGHHVYKEAAQLTRHAEEIGIDFAIGLNPYFPINPSDALVRNWYRSLTAESSIPMFLFNTAYSGYEISHELISELADLETVCGIKHPKPVDEVVALNEVVGDRIVVCDAAENEWLTLHLDHGFPSLMSTPALALFQTPQHRPVLDYTRLADTGKVEEARELSDTLEGERKAFERWMRDPWLTQRAGAIPIAELKAWLGLMGLSQGSVRPPLVRLSDREMHKLRSDLDGLDLLDTIDLTGA